MMLQNPTGYNIEFFISHSLFESSSIRIVKSFYKLNTTKHSRGTPLQSMTIINPDEKVTRPTDFGPSSVKLLNPTIRLLIALFYQTWV